MNRLPLVSVQIVTWNSGRTIRRCLQSLVDQDGYELGLNLFVQVLDNHSADDSVAQAESLWREGVLIVRLPNNFGFCGAHNHGLSRLPSQKAAAVLLLNPDAALKHDALKNMVEALFRDSSAGLVTPLIMRSAEDLTPLPSQLVDAAGMLMTPALRHFDRGSDQVLNESLLKAEYVFGGTGACLLLRSEFINDAARRPSEETDHSLQAVPLLDERFFAYREDAELSWWAQRLGWQCRYEPQAVCYHVRKVLPERRAELPPEINLYSVRNRFLMQLYHFGIFSSLRITAAAAVRNAAVIFGVLLNERSSLPALKEIAVNFRELLIKRRFYGRLARVSHARAQRWFTGMQSEPCLSQRKRPIEIKSVTAAIINFNSGDRLSTALAAASKAARILSPRRELRIVVVDNASSDGSAECVESRGGLLLRSEKNAGFAGGVNLASRGCTSDAVLILNPDVEITAEAVDALCRAIEQNEDVEFSAPVLVSRNGEPQLGFIARRFPSLGQLASETFLLHRIFPKNSHTSRYLYKDDYLLERFFNRLTPDFPGPHYAPAGCVIVEQPAGACLMVRRKALEALGGMDEAFWPAWFEDVDLCVRAKKAGMLAVIAGAARVVHEGGYSVNAIGRERFHRIWDENLLRFWTKHESGTRLLLAKILIVLGRTLRFPHRKGSTT